MVKELWFWNLALITKIGLNETVESSMPQHELRPESIEKRLPRGWKATELLSFLAQVL